MWLLVLLPITGGTLAGDFLAVSTVFLQAGSATWPTVQGTITRSEVETVRSNKSISYRPLVAYTYSVDGQTYEGNKHRISSWSGGELEAAEAMVARYPIGASIPVYYRPSQPSTATLLPGLGNAELFLLMILLPFNLAALALCVIVARIWQPERPLVAPFFREDGSECVTLDVLGTDAWVAMALGGAAFLGPVVGGLSGAYNAPLFVGVGAWAVVIACGVLAGRLANSRLKSGHHDLRIDHPSRSLSLPPIAGRRRRFDVRWSDVRSLRVGEPVRGNQRGSETHYPLMLEYITADGEPHEETIARCTRQGQAEAMEQWLRTRLKLGEETPEARRPARAPAKTTGSSRA
ncbi:hypothetical protein A176_005214 [Myxococcus hansupus]|uniref:DUF3592 domain-containing protein n=1 Tax=Pseudomyxococcus hansupus TaxID=1297742 RepID=A0A0H4XJ54_9BACT|nr:DUF3592 domain-containing protein [Myxococcus hansupus]AKQ68302.1 hypothetical protein A176_005214 [Myxococcus hansupus]